MYLFPIESVDLEQIITWNYLVADVEKISWEWDGREEIIIEKKKIKYIDEWVFENESWIIKVRTRDNEYTVYPNRRIEQLTGQNQSLSNSSYRTVSDTDVPGVQSQTLRSSRTTESNSEIGPDTVSDSEPGPGSAESETEHLDRW